jgi:hypothetical protein
MIPRNICDAVVCILSRRIRIAVLLYIPRVRIRISAFLFTVVTSVYK